MGALAMQSFGFDDQLVRVVDQSGAPWFVAQDVCACLEIGNSRQAVAALDDDEKGVTTTDTLGGMQQITIISESGVYSLIFRSRKAAAVKFRKWVTSEVLPTLRRTGAYVMAANDAVEPVDDMPEMIEERQTMVRLAVVKESMRIFGRKAAQGVWVQLGLPTGRDAPGTALAMARGIRDVSESVTEWIARCTEPAPGQWCASGTLYDSYRAFCVRSGVVPDNMTCWGLSMRALGHPSRKNNNSGKMDRAGLRLTD